MIWVLSLFFTDPTAHALVAVRNHLHLQIRGGCETHFQLFYRNSNTPDEFFAFQSDSDLHPSLIPPVILGDGFPWDFDEVQTSQEFYHAGETTSLCFQHQFEQSPYLFRPPIGNFPPLTLTLFFHVNHYSQRDLIRMRWCLALFFQSYKCRLLLPELKLCILQAWDLDCVFHFQVMNNLFYCCIGRQPDDYFIRLP